MIEEELESLQREKSVLVERLVHQEKLVVGLREQDKKRFRIQVSMEEQSSKLVDAYNQLVVETEVEEAMQF